MIIYITKPGKLKYVLIQVNLNALNIAFAIAKLASLRISCVILNLITLFII